MKRHGVWCAAAIIIGVVPFASSVNAETIGVFTKSAGNPIAKAARAGADQVGKSLGVTIFHYIPTSPDNVPQQTFLVEEALRQKRDALVFTPVDVKAMVPVIQKVNAAGVPMVNVGDRLTGGESVAFIGTDDYAIALATARALFKAMDNKGNLIVLEGPPNLPTAVARQKGFQDALKGAPNIKVVLSKNANYARPVAGDLLRAMLKANPNQQIDGVLAANDAMAFGAVEAFKEAKKKLPLITGINASKEAVDMIKAGDLFASGDDNGLIEGCLGAEIAIRTVRKEPVPKEVLAKTEVVTKDNIGPYETPVEKRPCPTLASTGAK
jgi:ribose transport system substrate-binding protein